MMTPAPLPADIRAIIFDCDGTLADTFGAHFRAFRDILADYQVSFEAEFYHARLGLSRYQLLEDLKQVQGKPFDEQAVAERNTAAFLAHQSAIRPIPHTHDILRNQYGRLRLGVASGGQRPIVEATLEAIGALSTSARFTGPIRPTGNQGYSLLCDQPPLVVSRRN